MNKIIFLGGVILAVTGLVSPAIALLGGLIYGLTLAHPFQAQSRDLTKFLLQGSVVALGFGMNLHEVLHAGRSGFVYTAVSITAALLLGLGLGYVIRVSEKPSFLISAGTAICGGSAIAAVGPIIDASEEEMAVSLGAVFILNSVALFLFPPVGFALHMSEGQFGLWSALAIHDTSSVVGATAKYGAIALAIGTTIKLARALWGTAEYLAAAVRCGLRCAESHGEVGSDRDAIPDWCKPEQGNAAEGWDSAAPTGPHAVGYRWSQHAGADSV